MIEVTFIETEESNGMCALQSFLNEIGEENIISIQQARRRTRGGGTPMGTMIIHRCIEDDTVERAAAEIRTLLQKGVVAQKEGNPDG